MRKKSAPIIALLIVLALLLLAVAGWWAVPKFAPKLLAHYTNAQLHGTPLVLKNIGQLSLGPEGEIELKNMQLQAQLQPEIWLAHYNHQSHKSSATFTLPVASSLPARKINLSGEVQVAMNGLMAESTVTFKLSLSAPTANTRLLQLTLSAPTSAGGLMSGKIDISADWVDATQYELKLTPQALSLFAGLDIEALNGEVVLRSKSEPAIDLSAKYIARNEVSLQNITLKWHKQQGLLAAQWLEKSLSINATQKSAQTYQLHAKLDKYPAEALLQLGAPAMLQNINGSIAGGRWSIAPLALSSTMLDAPINLELHKIDLGQLAQLLAIDGLSMSGTLSGQVPLLWQEAQWRIGKGAMLSSGQGTIQYNPKKYPAALAGEATQMQIVRQALQNFALSSMALNLSGAPLGEISAQLALKGHNEALFGQQPIHFNLSVTGPIAPLIKNFAPNSADGNSGDTTESP